MDRVVRRELVTLMMGMILIVLISRMKIMMVMMEMVVMVEMVMEMMVEMVTEMEETVEMGMMTMMIITMHRWLRDGLRRSTMTWRVKATTTLGFSHLCIATTPEALFSTGRSIGPTPTTSASGR